MRQFKYIIILLAGLAFLMQGCAESTLSLDQSDFFVAFDTKNDVQKSISMIEGDDVVVAINVSATTGSSITVDFDVEVPNVSDPVSARYELLNLDGTPLGSQTLTFPEGTGSQSFIFRATDNEIEDGNRTFILRITGNSANYRIGVNDERKEGATMPISVKDDDIVITPEQFLGTWTVVEGDRYFSGGWQEDDTYTVTVENVNATYDGNVRIIGFTNDPEEVIYATIELEGKVKTCVVPAQQIIPTWSGTMDTWFLAYGQPDNPVAMSATIQRSDDASTLTMNFGSAYTYMYAACAIGQGPAGYAGFFWVGYDTVFSREIK